MTDRILTVTTSAELKSAVEMLAAGEGGTVRIAPGTYALALSDHAYERTDAPVRLTSLDPGRPATFTSLKLQGREDVTVDHVVFDSTDADVSAYHRDLDLVGSRDVVISDSVFRAGATEALDGSAGQVRAVDLALVRNVDGLVMRDNHMSGYNHGVALFETDDVQILGNEITGFQGDGIRIAGVQDALIEGNHMHSMLGSAHGINHSDMIQFWGTNIRQNSERVTIRGNVIDSGDGASYQMIFGRNEDKATNGYRFQDILIEENLVYGAQYNMISVADTENMVVRHNTVLWNRDAHEVLPDGGGKGASVPGWIAAPNGKGAVVEGNLAATVRNGTGANATIGYDDPDAANHHARHFVNLEAGGTADLRDLSLRADSAWDGVLGASMTWSDRPVDGLTATATVERVPGDRSLVRLDAGLTRDERGAVRDATYLWTFEDGTERRGATVEHDFETPGEHRYTLSVRTADGRTDRIERKVEVADPDLLVLDLTDGRVRDEGSYRTGVAATDGALGEEGFVLDGTSRIDVSRGAEHLFGLDSFAMTLDVTLKAGTTGTLVELWESFAGRVEGSGAFVFHIETTEGAFRLATAPGALPRGERAEIGVVLDGVAGELRLLVDGEVEATTAVRGGTKPMKHWGIVLGNEFDGHSVKGVLHGVRLRSEPELEGGVSGVKGTGASWDDDAPGEDAAPNRDALLAEVDFDEGVVDGSGRGTGITYDEEALTFAEGSDGTGRSVALGMGEGGVVLNRANTHLFELDEFHMAFDLRRDDLDAGGSVLNLHQTLSVKLDAPGRLTFDLETDEGRGVIETEAPLLDGPGWYAIELAYDGEAGRMELVVDGEVAGHAELTGTTAPAKYWGLALGQQWNGAAPGFIDELRIWDEAHLRGGAALRDEDAGIAARMVASDAGDDLLLAAFDFDGDLTERDGRGVGVHADDGLGFTAGRDGGQAVRIGDDARFAVTRENAFLHERDAFAMSFDLRKDDAAGEGRVVQLHKAMLARVVDDELEFTLTTDEGSFTVATESGAMDDADWHSVEIAYDDAMGRLTLAVDGARTEAQASGETAPAKYWGLSLGAAWGDVLEGAVDGFEFHAEPGWDGA